MTEDELADHFETNRALAIRKAHRRFPYMEPETLDMLYTDCWYSLKDATFMLKSLKSYLESALANRVKDHLRNRARSQDLFERYVRVGSTNNDEEGKLLEYIANLPDTREDESDVRWEIIERVRTVMEQVPRTLGLVANWYYVDEMKEADIAERLQCSQPHVCKLLLKFRSEFKTRYYALYNAEDHLCHTR